MARRTHKAGLLAAITLLAACDEAPPEPLSNEEAIEPILEQTVGATPTELLEKIASNFYPTFEIAKGIGGERSESWDKARFQSELAAAFAPLSDQIDAAFAANVAGEMAQGEGQKLLDMLAEGKNADFASCVFTSDDAGQGGRFDSCKTSTGAEAPQELQDALGDLANRMARALQYDEKLDVATSYATCSVLAKFGKEVTTKDLSVDLGDTKLGFGGDKQPCTAYDEIAANAFGKDIKPNFPDAEAAK